MLTTSGLLLLIILSAVGGTTLGIVTGLIPGLHVNTVALLILGITPLWLSNKPLFLAAQEALMAEVVVVVSLSVSHTFHDYLRIAMSINFLRPAPAVRKQNRRRGNSESVRSRRARWPINESPGECRFGVANKKSIVKLMGLSCW